MNVVHFTTQCALIGCWCHLCSKKSSTVKNKIICSICWKMSQIRSKLMECGLKIHWPYYLHSNERVNFETGRSTSEVQVDLFTSGYHRVDLLRRTILVDLLWGRVGESTSEEKHVFLSYRIGCVINGHNHH